VMAFAEGNEFMKIMAGCGFSNINQRRLTFGIATIYSGEKL